MKKITLAIILLITFSAAILTFLLYSNYIKTLETNKSESKQEVVAITTTTQPITTTTTSQIKQTTTTQTNIANNEVILSASGFSISTITLNSGTPLIVINKDSKTHNLIIKELQITYVLEPNDKMEFPTLEKGSFTIEDKETGSTLILKVV